MGSFADQKMTEILWKFVLFYSMTYFYLGKKKGPLVGCRHSLVLWWFLGFLTYPLPLPHKHIISHWGQDLLSLKYLLFFPSKKEERPQGGTRHSLGVLVVPRIPHLSIASAA